MALLKERNMKPPIKTGVNRGATKIATIASGVFLLAMFGLVALPPDMGYAQQPPPPCHPNRQANEDMATVRTRGDIRHLPDPLKDRLVELGGRPPSQMPTQRLSAAPEHHPR